MKFTKIALACGLAFNAMSAHAVLVAANPTVPAGATSIYLSGASAPDNFLADIMATGSSAMLSSVVHVIEDTSSGTTVSASASNYRAYIGKANNIGTGANAIPNGTDIVFYKRSAGGSAQGVVPVGKATKLVTLNLASCVADNGVAPTVATGAMGSITNPYRCKQTTAAAGLVPDFGVSDVEPAMFQAPYNEELGFTALTQTEFGNLTASGVNQIMMGIAATNAVADTVEFNKAVYANILAGKYADWSEIDGSDPYDGTTGDPMIVCRRTPGSGTQASYNWFFSGFPCVSTASVTALAPVRMTDSAGGLDDSTAGTLADPWLLDPSQGFTVVENSGSGDVRNCLKGANTQTDTIVAVEGNKRVKVLFSNLPNPGKAVGVLSLDSYKSAGTDWTFRNLNGAGVYNADTQTAVSGPATGVAPSKANLLNGTYDFVVELSMQARNTTVAGVAPFLGTNNTKDKFYKEFVKRVGSPKFTGTAATSTPNAFASLPNLYPATGDASAVTGVAGTLYQDLVAKNTRFANTCSGLVKFVE